MAFRTLGPSCLLCHLPDPEVLLPAGGLLTCLGIGQSHLCQPLAALLGPESPILAQKPCTSDSWILGSTWPLPLWGEPGRGSAGGSRAGGGREGTHHSDHGRCRGTGRRRRPPAGWGRSCATDGLPRRPGSPQRPLQSPAHPSDGERTKQRGCHTKPLGGTMALTECSPHPLLLSPSRPLGEEAQ